MKLYSQNSAKINSTSSTTYVVGSNLLANLPEIITDLKTYSSLVLLSDSNTYRLYGKTVSGSLKKSGVPLLSIKLAPGERAKGISTFQKIIRELLENKITRNSCIISLGGGVISDISGFIASVYMRGLPLVNIPTTLLSQIDAALGGKNGINIKTGNLLLKNMVGTFKQPELVISDIDVLKTLPKSEIENGLGEMVKYSIGWGTPAPDDLVQILKLNNGPGISAAISLCQKLKMEVIESDPFELKGARQKLNLGHTVGHAIEAASFGKLSHGQCVSIGIVASAKISLVKKMLAPSEYEKIIKTISNLGLPKTAVNINQQSVVSALASDKKSGTFVLIEKIGKLITGVKVEAEIINRVLNEILL